MRRIPRPFIVKGLVGKAFWRVIPVGDAGAATAAQLPWFANAESDLTGYCLLHRTPSGADNCMVDVWKVTSHTAYYFALTAYGNSSRVGDPSVVTESVWC